MLSFPKFKNILCFGVLCNSSTSDPFPHAPPQMNHTLQLDVSDDPGLQKPRASYTTPSTPTEPDQCIPTVTGPQISSPVDVQSFCILWDKTCRGNRTAALKRFFEPSNSVTTHPCFLDASSSCSDHQPPAVLSTLGNLKNWMRSPQCWSSAVEKASIFDDTELEEGARQSTCCGQCYLLGSNVKVYYWPEPNSDTSCLSIIGNITRPPLYGGTTACDGNQHWGCFGPNSTYITTATLSQFGPLTYKHFLHNPWEESLCATTPIPTPTNTDEQISPTFIYARGNSLITSPTRSQNDERAPRSVVTDGFTL